MFRTPNGTRKTIQHGSCVAQWTEQMFPQEQLAMDNQPFCLFQLCSIKVSIFYRPRPSPRLVRPLSNAGMTFVSQTLCSNAPPITHRSVVASHPRKHLSNFLKQSLLSCYDTVHECGRRTHFRHPLLCPRSVSYALAIQSPLPHIKRRPPPVTPVLARLQWHTLPLYFHPLALFTSSTCFREYSMFSKFLYY